MPDDFQGLADFMSPEPPTSDPAPAPTAESAPAATAAAPARAPEAPVEPPAPTDGLQQQQQAETEFEWPTVPEDQPNVDPFAQFADPNALQALANDPQALFQRAQAAEELLRTTQGRAQNWNDWESKAATYLGGAKYIPFAVELVGDLLSQSGAQDLATETPEAIDKFLRRVDEVAPGTSDGLLVALARRHSDALLNLFQPKLMEQLGLRPDLIEAYRTLTITGQYTQGQDVQAELDFLQRIPRPQHDAFRALPQFKRDALMRASDEEARWEMEQIHKGYVADQREAAQTAEREQAQQYEREVKFADSLEQEYMTLFDGFVEQGKALFKGDVVRAAGVAALAYTEFQKQMLAEKQSMRAQDRVNLNKFERALLSGNQLAADKARNDVRAMLTKIWRQTLNQHGQRKPAAAPPVPSNQRQPENPNRNNAPQFDPTLPEAPNGETQSLAAIMARMARQPTSALQQFGWEPQ